MKSYLKGKLWAGCFKWNENRYLESAFRSTQKDLRYLSIFLKISRPVLSLLEIVWVKFKTALHSVSTSRLLRGVTFEATYWNSSLKGPVCLLEKVFLVIIFTPAEHRQQQLPLIFLSNIIDNGCARCTWVFFVCQTWFSLLWDGNLLIELVGGCLYLEYLWRNFPVSRRYLINCCYRNPPLARFYLFGNWKVIIFFASYVKMSWMMIWRIQSHKKFRQFFGSLELLFFICLIFKSILTWFFGTSTT